MKPQHTLLLALLGVLVAAEAALGLSVVPTSNTTNLVTTLMGQGITVKNVAFNCPNDAAGIFNEGMLAVGISHGIILTSGLATYAEPPNIFSDLGEDRSSPGDDDLDALILPYATFDACTLTFTFESDIDRISFDYVFGSEEYPEWVGSDYNDVFAFYLDGENIALVPGTTVPVAINNVNANSYSQYFLDNVSDYDRPTQYDGFTTVLRAFKSGLTPGQHVLKIAIADSGDHVLDSGVFLSRFCDGACVHGGPYTATSTGPVSTVALDGSASYRTNAFSWEVINWATHIFTPSHAVAKPTLTLVGDPCSMPDHVVLQLTVTMPNGAERVCSTTIAIDRSSCSCNDATDSDSDGTLDCDDKCPNDPAKDYPGFCGCGVSDANADSDSMPDCMDDCPNDPLKIVAGVCGCGVKDQDTDKDGTLNCNDQCPNDPSKVAPGVCGCGVSDTDSDLDGTPDCNDQCPNDATKTAPGQCGCGASDTDSDSDGTADCNDQCPLSAVKTAPGVCGCFQPDVDSDSDGLLDCQEDCPHNSAKQTPGQCGCSYPDTDSDSDGSADCVDLCPADPGKSAPGLCGCGASDADSDSDGTADCNDLCPSDSLKVAPGVCGCGTADSDTDGDSTPDCNDQCPSDPAKTAPGICSCGTADTDTDGDGTADCYDQCSVDDQKIAPGACGCGLADSDSDSDGVYDCQEECRFDPHKTQPGVCGCGTAETVCQQSNCTMYPTSMYESAFLNDCDGLPSANTTGMNPWLPRECRAVKIFMNLWTHYVAKPLPDGSSFALQVQGHAVPLLVTFSEGLFRKACNDDFSCVNGYAVSGPFVGWKGKVGDFQMKLPHAAQYDCYHKDCCFRCDESYVLYDGCAGMEFVPNEENPFGNSYPPFTAEECAAVKMAINNLRVRGNAPDPWAVLPAEWRGVFRVYGQERGLYVAHRADGKWFKRCNSQHDCTTGYALPANQWYKYDYQVFVGDFLLNLDNWDCRKDRCHFKCATFGVYP